MAYHTYFRDQTSSFYRKIIDVEKEIKELKAENKEFQESLIESKNKAPGKKAASTKPRKNRVRRAPINLIDIQAIFSNPNN